MAEYVQLITTTGKRNDAEQIASELVSRRFAACVQVSGPVISTFRWDGKIETAEEWTCTIKTSASQLANIQNLFSQIHPYEVPELIATPIIDGNPAYLKWLDEQVK
jgi:periplasmic divalent cation tolerance protein